MLNSFVILQYIPYMAMLAFSQVVFLLWRFHLLFLFSFFTETLRAGISSMSSQQDVTIEGSVSFFFILAIYTVLAKEYGTSWDSHIYDQSDCSLAIVFYNESLRLFVSTGLAIILYVFSHITQVLHVFNMFCTSEFYQTALIQPTRIVTDES